MGRRIAAKRWSVVLASTFAVLGAAAALPASAAASSGTITYGSIVVDDAHQDVFVSVPSANEVDEFSFSGSLVTSIPDIYGAWGMTINGSSLYVAESTTGEIVSFDLDASPLAPTEVTDGLNEPSTLAFAGGQLWTALAGDAGQWDDSVVSVDPSSGAVTTLPVAIDYPLVAAAAGDPGALYVAEEGQSPGEIYKFDVSSSPATELLDVWEMDDANIQDLAISADGTRVIPAAGAPYEFQEFSAATLKPDGLIYPAEPYPTAVAVSQSGLLAGGLEGYDSPNILVYPLGAPAATFSATTSTVDGESDVLPGGLALSADGTELFAVAANPAGLEFDTFSLGSQPPGDPPPTPTPTTTTTITPPAPATSSPPTTSTPIPAGSSPIALLPTTTTVITAPAASTEARSKSSLAVLGDSDSIRGRPEVTMSFGAVRASVVSAQTHAVTGYRYFFDARDIRCSGGASSVSFSIAGSRRQVACGSGTFVISRSVSLNRTYRLTATAVDSRAGKAKHDGPAHVVRLRIPARRVHWIAISSGG